MQTSPIDLSCRCSIFWKDEKNLAHGVTRNELRKVKSIVNLIGGDKLLSLPYTQYQCLKGLHVYSNRREESNELELSIWNQPKEEKDSRCLFADRISVPAFIAGADYWKPKGQPSSPE